MKSFTDKNGSAWSINLDVGTLLSIKQELGFDILDNPGDFPANVSDFVNVLWVALREQIENQNLDEIGFAKCLDGETVNTATDCFIEELANFFLPVDKAKAQAVRGMWDNLKNLKEIEAKTVENLLGVVSSGLAASSGST